MLTSREMAALALELRISEGRRDISPRCLRLMSSAGKMTIVFEQEQRCRLVLQNTKEMGQTDAYQPRNGRLRLRTAPEYAIIGRGVSV